MKTRSAIVRLDGIRVGTLHERIGGDMTFHYDSTWVTTPNAVPVSLTLPLRNEPYTHRGLHPFFENLLPEGWLLELATKKLKISKDDAFGLLLATCADCVGAVEVVPDDTIEAHREHRDEKGAERSDLGGDNIPRSPSIDREGDR